MSDGASSIRFDFGDLGEGGPYQALASCRQIVLGPLGALSIHLVIDGGADGVPPADEPLGKFEIYTAGDEAAPPCRFEGSDARGTAIDELLAVAGNVAVNVAASLIDLPGARAKVRYARNDGGGVNTRARLWITVR